ncbi:type I glyceraldehyde-3-phosphate dehydrogenase [uncultured Neptuniibacter sp.]|uniref:type I glyceraldehyde-3-phosphate dehydrogenase n=1 Tax=uncultured Neptuniibacter sp. TaxID=502143 RepID=UPI0026197791|nr:type I glyceraldehyde-3-phosphate dehydrogenase [uncultured Neptuniibacter sp.]
MTTRIAINGYGRIGRNILRALYESGCDDLKIVAINDLCDPKVNAHLTEYDSVHGKFRYSVTSDEGSLCIRDDVIRVFHEKDPEALPWQSLEIDIVFECTGLFTNKKAAEVHLRRGAKRVLVSAPASKADATVVYGVNHHTISPNDSVISNASCTTNCLAPMAQVLHQAFGIRSGMMTTIHAYTNDQHLTDAFSGDLYRARAAATSMIPTRTGAAAAVGIVLPELDGKLSGMAVRVPTSNVSLVDLAFIPERSCTVDEINASLLQASEGDYRGIIGYNDKPLVSVDFNHHSESCIFDSTQTLCDRDLVKVFAWYDNEWGFSNRMLDTARYITKFL